MEYLEQIGPNEAGIVDRVFSDVEASLSHLYLLGRRRSHPGQDPWQEPFELSFQREFRLPSGKRIDLHAHDRRGRAHWVIEFKQLADHRALIQVDKYRRELIHSLWQRRFKFVQASLVARAFTDECVYFSEHLGIQLLQFNQVTPTKFKIESIVDWVRSNGGRRVLNPHKLNNKNPELMPWMWG